MIRGPFPPEALVYRDRDPVYADELYEAVGFHENDYGTVDGLEIYGHFCDSDGRFGASPGWIELTWLQPVTKGAREFMLVNGGKP